MSQAPRAIITVGLAAIALSGLVLARHRSEPSVRPPSQAPQLEVWSEPLILTALQLAPGRIGAATIASRPAQRTWLESLQELKEGTTITLPLPDGGARFGTIEIVRSDEGGWARVGGRLTGEGSFSFGSNGTSMGGLVQLPREGLAWRLRTAADGVAQYTKLPLNAVRCFLPRASFERDDPLPDESEQRAPRAVFSSRPEAIAVLFLDFNGAIVTDPNYANGRRIHAPQARLNISQITDVFNRVAGDFASFDVDVTTNPMRYANAPVGRRMRCIITSNDQAGPGTGGGSYVDSFSAAGTGEFTSDIPCWVFRDRDVDNCAEAISHELGHTLGLGHDGRDFPGGRHQEYYPGHGRGRTGWAPIMGVSYRKGLSQWSKGEYKNASNREDDIATMARAANGFGFIADDAGDTIETAPDLGHDGPIVDRLANIQNQEDIDVFRLSTLGGRAAIQVKPVGRDANLDVLLELRDAAGATILANNPSSALTAGFRTDLAAGTYYLRVRGSGKADPLKHGYTAYGSIGSYRIVGKVSGLNAASVTDRQH